MGDVNSVNKLCQQAETHFFKAVVSVESLVKTSQNSSALLAALEKNNHTMALPLYCYACLVVGDITTAAMLLKKAEKKKH